MSTQYQSLVPEIQHAAKQVAPNGAISGEPLNQLLNSAVYLILVIAVVLAIFMIIRGGYEYMTSSDNSNKKGTAKKRLQAALGGLLLAIGAVLILKTINPNLVNFSIEFPGLEKPNTPPALVGSPNYFYDSSTNTFYDLDTNVSFQPQYGESVIPGRVAIDTDGKTKPPFNDPDYRPQTSYSGLDANVDNYVVVPIGSPIQLGTRVHLYDQDTGLSTWAIVGDRGQTKNGLGEMSLNAARNIGAWDQSLGNGAHDHSVIWTFYPEQ